MRVWLTQHANQAGQVKLAVFAVEADACGLEVGDFVHSFGDAHIYSNHFEQVRKQLQRTPRDLPELQLKKGVNSLFDYSYDDVKIIGYDPHPHIAGKVAV